MTTVPPFSTITLVVSVLVSRLPVVALVIVLLAMFSSRLTRLSGLMDGVTVRLSGAENV